MYQLVVRNNLGGANSSCVSALSPEGVIISITHRDQGPGRLQPMHGGMRPSIAELAGECQQHSLWAAPQGERSPSPAFEPLTPLDGSPHPAILAFRRF